MAYEPYQRHEPRHFVPPEVGYYSRPMMATPPLPPRLPPIGRLPETAMDPRYMLSSENGYMARQMVPQTLPLRMHHHGPPMESRSYPAVYEERSHSMLSQSREPDAYRTRTYDQESQHSNSSTAIHSPVFSEKSPASYQNPTPKPTSSTQEPKPPPKNPGYSMPHGFDKLLHHEPESSPPPPPRRTSTQSRYHLHVRQQPLAARACGAGDRDRRPVDPPPIVQILLTDFDPESQDDRDILEDPRFTVGCLLFPVSEKAPHLPNTDEDPSQEGGEGDGVARADDTFPTPLLSGKAFMSPFFVDADPDPNSAPTHPSFDNPHRAPSPDPSRPDNLRNASKLHQPATFFIFADLSIRSAGLYRLQFRLMNWGSVEDTGQSMPILAEAWSDPFRVYPAKDFPGMRDSSILAEGLKELGFVELKTRGKGKGKGRKRW